MESVKLEQQERVVLITIDRQPMLNALSRQVLAELKEAVESIDVKYSRCVVVTGAGGKAFVAGADIAEMQSMSKSEAEAFGSFGNSVFRLLEKLEVPVIAAVNGFALGGGCELALACDIRLASENAVFAQPEVGLGITAGFGGTQRLPRLIGEGLAKQLLFTGERISAQRALEIGLVNHVYPADELIPKALEMAGVIAAKAPIAISATKLAVEDGRFMSLDKALELEARHFASCFESEDQRQAMSAMLEKRKPQPFRGE
ncbi:MAG: enoyl-CoA hydratase-related protein [Defluviitaleaceae bacterium]|nr:enoyl-CoA hydratase-related protein [Defluviitaleaceae bacterium]